jgi:hypothetical protein
MNETSAGEILVRGLKALLACSDRESPVGRRLEEVLLFTTESQSGERTVQERCALLRSAAAVLETIHPAEPTRAENELMAITRLALTAAMFESPPVTAERTLLVRSH